jgi:outer membrane protein assembly factor BamB
MSLYEEIRDHASGSTFTSAGDLHEAIWFALLRDENADFHRVRLARGDGGIDAIRFTEPALNCAHICQAKFYQRLDDKHRDEVVRSFLAAHGHEFPCTRWTLLVPTHLSAPELSWLSVGLRAAAANLAPEKANAIAACQIDYMDVDALTHRLKANPSVVSEMLPRCSISLAKQLEEERAKREAAEVELAARRQSLSHERITPARLPTLRWKAFVGCQAWKNSPIIVGDDVLVGSAGHRWNQPDDADGLYCLDAETGRQKWFVHTLADAGRVLVSKGVAITGCDDGAVVAVSVSDGVVLWSACLDSGVVGGPLKLPAGIGRRVGGQDAPQRVDPVLLATHEGTLCVLDLDTGRELQRLAVGGPIIAAPTLYQSGRKEVVLVPCLDGHLLFVEYNHVRGKLVCNGAIKITSPTAYQPERTSLAAETAWTDGLLVQGVVRDTYYPDPPLVAVDARTRSIRWMASDPRRFGEGFGNLRGRPVVLGEHVIFATAYSRKLCALSLDDGTVCWTVDLGQAMFEQWCGPVLDGQAVYIGRHDGYIHRVDAGRRRRDWSMFLGNEARAGAAVWGHQVSPEFDAPAAWMAGNSAPILATPALDRGRLFVGSRSGYLFCVTNLGDDGP